MDFEDLASIRERFWQPGAASLQKPRLADVYRLVQQHRPRSFIEIGTATGLTTALVAHMLESHGGTRVVTVDYSEQFYGDRSRQTGFVIPDAYPSGPVGIERRRGTTSVAAPGWGETFDMGFVDGNHQHPWPLIDTLCLFPVMRGPRVLLHDDLNLYRRGQGHRIGPKYVYDQFPDSRRTRLGARGNVFALDLTLPQEQFEEIVGEAVAMRWTTPGPLPQEVLDGLRHVLNRHYSAGLSKEFERAIERFSS